MHRQRGPWLAASGDTCSDANELTLQFALQVERGMIRRVNFKASTCITLVAYAELLAERVTGQELKQAIRVDAEDLVQALCEVPPGKQDRARLPILALQSAIKEATIDQGGTR